LDTAFNKNKIGNILNEENIDELLEEYSCDNFRVILPDSLYTQDFDLKRLNIFINIQKQIINIHKG